MCCAGTRVIGANSVVLNVSELSEMNLSDKVDDWLGLPLAIIADDPHLAFRPLCRNEQFYSRNSLFTMSRSWEQDCFGADLDRI